MIIVVANYSHKLLVPFFIVLYIFFMSTDFTNVFSCFSEISNQKLADRPPSPELNTAMPDISDDNFHPSGESSGNSFNV